MKSNLVIEILVFLTSFTLVSCGAGTTPVIKEQQSGLDISSRDDVQFMNMPVSASRLATNTNSDRRVEEAKTKAAIYSARALVNNAGKNSRSRAIAELAMVAAKANLSITEAQIHVAVEKLRLSNLKLASNDLAGGNQIIFNTMPVLLLVHLRQSKIFGSLRKEPAISLIVGTFDGPTRGETVLRLEPWATYLISWQEIRFTREGDISFSPLIRGNPLKIRKRPYYQYGDKIYNGAYLIRPQKK